MKNSRMESETTGLDPRMMTSWWLVSLELDTTDISTWLQWPGFPPPDLTQFILSGTLWGRAPTGGEDSAPTRRAGAGGWATRP
jgi:hypothetical protein